VHGTKGGTGKSLVHWKPIRKDTGEKEKPRNGKLRVGPTLDKNPQPLSDKVLIITTRNELGGKFARNEEKKKTSATLRSQKNNKKTNLDANR